MAGEESHPQMNKDQTRDEEMIRETGEPWTRDKTEVHDAEDSWTLDGAGIC